MLCRAALSCSSIASSRCSRTWRSLIRFSTLRLGPGRALVLRGGREGMGRYAPVLGGLGAAAGCGATLAAAGTGAGSMVAAVH